MGATNRHMQDLLGRLWAACERLPEFGGDLWGRGLGKIEEKYGVALYLSRFEMQGTTEGECPQMTVTITPTEGT